MSARFSSDWDLSQPVRLQLRHHVVSAEVDGETVLLDTDSEEYFGFEQIGTTVWDTVNDSPSLRHAIERLASTFVIPAEDMRRDVLHFLDELAASGLLEPLQATGVNPARQM